MSDIIICPICGPVTEDFIGQHWALVHPNEDEEFMDRWHEELCREEDE